MSDLVPSNRTQIDPHLLEQGLLLLDPNANKATAAKVVLVRVVKATATVPAAVSTAAAAAAAAISASKPAAVAAAAATEPAAAKSTSKTPSTSTTAAAAHRSKVQGAQEGQSQLRATVIRKRASGHSTSRAGTDPSLVTEAAEWPRLPLGDNAPVAGAAAASAAATVAAAAATVAATAAAAAAITATVTAAVELRSAAAHGNLLASQQWTRAGNCPRAARRQVE